MECSLYVGQTLYHRILNDVKIKEIHNQQIIVETKNKGNLPFSINDIGKVLYFKREHKNLRFETYKEYKDYIIEENEQECKEAFEQYIKEETQKILEEYKKEETQKAKLINLLKSTYEFEGFHHYTDMNNFIRIMEEGKVFCRTGIDWNFFEDAANSDVIKKTRNNIKEYVRFYYKEKTPTLYSNEGIKEKNEKPHMPIPVLLLFNENIIYHENIAFLSGCGGSMYSDLTSNINNAMQFDWEKIFSRGPYNNEDYRIKNKRNAEFLYKKEIDIKYLKKIVFRSPADLKKAQILLGDNELYTVDHSGKKFNYNHNFLYNYHFEIVNDGVLIALQYYTGSYDRYTHNLIVYYCNGSKETFDINKISTYRKKTIKKPLMYEDYDFCFVLKTKYKKIMGECKIIDIFKVEYYMNDHLSAVYIHNS